MENKFYTDEFERLLRERTDEFRMYPSKRVWHSIYNDLHPGRRWPSVVMSMLLIVALLFMGHLNNDTGRSTDTFVADGKGNTSIAKNDIGHTHSSTQDMASITNNIQTPPSSLARNNASISNIATIVDNNAHTTPIANDASRRTTPSQGTSATGHHTTTVRDNITPGIFATSPKTAAVERNIIVTEDIAANIPATTEEEDILATNNTSRNSSPVNIAATAIDNDLEINKDKKTIQVSTDKEKVRTMTQENEKAWIDDHAFYNRSARKKWKDRMAMEMYITPSLGYRSLSGNSVYYPSATVPLAADMNTGNNDVSKAVDQTPGIGLEAGFGMVYNVAKRFRLKGGLQVNLTNYNIHADRTSHPALTTLLLNDLNTGNTYISSTMSSFANSSSYQPVVLHNKTYQLSVPLGVAMKLYGNDKMEWYAGASIQPSFIFKGQGYLISSDRKNYVDDPRFIRKWNINTGLETYLSYNLGNFDLQAGPQFRYQLYPTYNKQYTNTEKLYNIGIKVGLLKNF